MLNRKVLLLLLTSDVYRVRSCWPWAVCALSLRALKSNTHTHTEHERRYDRVAHTKKILTVSARKCRTNSCVTAAQRARQREERKRERGRERARLITNRNK